MGSRGKRAAVVGAGFGGLAVAIRLQNAGFDTIVFEKGDQPGGRAYVYHDDGFVFDAGPTVITAPHCLEELFTEAGRSMADYVELIPVSPFYRLVWDDGDTLDYVGDTARMLEQIRRRCPEDVDGYLRFLDYSRRVFEKGYLELASTPFLRFADMVRVAPQLARLRADRSVYRTVSRFVRDEHLRQALSFHTLLVGGNPFDTSSIYTLIHHLERHWGVYVSARRDRRTGARVGDAAAGAGRRGTPLVARRTHPGRLQRRRGSPGHDPPRHRNLRPSGVERRPASHIRRAAARRAVGGADDEVARVARLVDVALRPLLRHQPDIPRPRRASHCAVRPALQGAARRGVPRLAPSRRLQPLPPRADRHGSIVSAPGLRQLLRPLAGPASRPRAARLAHGRARVRRQDLRGARASAAGPAPARGDPALAHAGDVPGRAQRLSRVGVQLRAEADPERVVAAPQPRCTHPAASTSSAPGRTRARACRAS